MPKLHVDNLHEMLFRKKLISDTKSLRCFTALKNNYFLYRRGLIADTLKPVLLFFFRNFQQLY